MKKQISNEQRAMSNGSARQRNSKLLLLIASCSLLITGGGAADAAKLCRVAFQTLENEGATVAPDGTYSTGPAGGAFTSYLNENFPVSGRGKCAGNEAQLVYDNKVTDATDNAGAMCYCKMTAPRAGEWIMLGYIGAGCPDECARHCGHRLQKMHTYKAMFMSI
ncbi:MAG: hypothetical protein LBL46_01390 [Rickettsiales bacterium]|nr:hypothetical protein [Rickettsiales bacterium]